jgi:hypothetical protein
LLCLQAAQARFGIADIDSTSGYEYGHFDATLDSAGQKIGSSPSRLIAQAADSRRQQFAISVTEDRGGSEQVRRPAATARNEDEMAIHRSGSRRMSKQLSLQSRSLWPSVKASSSAVTWAIRST